MVLELALAAALQAGDRIDLNCEMRAQLQPLEVTLDDGTERRFSVSQARAMMFEGEPETLGFVSGDRSDHAFLASIAQDGSGAQVRFEESFDQFEGGVMTWKSAQVLPDRIVLDLGGVENVVISRLNGRLQGEIELTLPSDAIEGDEEGEVTAVTIRLTGRCERILPEDRLF